MTPPHSATDSDHELAARLATDAGRLLLTVREKYADASVAERKDAGDAEAQRFLASALAAERPGDAVLSEEADDDRARLAADRVWIVDPLDGTREFGQPGRDDWAVHVALWERGDLTAAAVSLPVEGRTLATPEIARPDTADGAGPRVIASRSRPPAIAEEVADRLGGTLIGMGSAGAKAMAVVLGRADVYLHTGGLHEWDTAAPVGVARAAGLHTSRVDGSPLAYNQADVYQPDLLICAPRYVDSVLALVHEYGAGCRYR
ncbi:MAG TPA: 3'(2'),5'-bisphosphate nucleotidase CysQ [Pseudonocardia sp.]